MRILIVLLLLTASCLSLKAQQKDIINGVEKAFQARDITPLTRWLGEDFRLAGVTGKEAQKNLYYFLKNYSFDSIAYVNDSINDSLTNVQFNLFQKEGVVKKMIVAINRNSAIQYIDLADAFFGMNRNQESRLRAEIPFENQAGKIIISLKINNYPEPLRFLFDTGADGMAVNPALAKKIGLNVTRSNDAAVVGGNMQIQVSDRNQVHFGDFTMPQMGIAIFDGMSKDTDGLIGNTFLRRYITEIDYDNNMIRLYDFGKNAPVSNGTPIDVKMPNGLLLVPVTVDITNEKGGTGNFVFDSGASYNLICFRNFVQRHKLLVGGFVSKHDGVTVSMGMQTPTFTGMAQSVHFGLSHKGTATPITLMAGYRESDKNLPHDGSLGIRLMSKYNMLINLQEGKIYFTLTRKARYQTIL